LGWFDTAMAGKAGGIREVGTRKEERGKRNDHDKLP
jgi:hypothetical protein